MVKPSNRYRSDTEAGTLIDIDSPKKIEETQGGLLDYDRSDAGEAQRIADQYGGDIHLLLTDVIKAGTLI